MVIFMCFLVIWGAKEHLETYHNCEGRGGRWSIIHINEDGFKPLQPLLPVHTGPGGAAGWAGAPKGGAKPPLQ